MINRGVNLSCKLGADVGGEGKGHGKVYFYSGVKDTEIELMEGLQHSCGDWLVE